jgi:hypothetical protein
MNKGRHAIRQGLALAAFGLAVGGGLVAGSCSFTLDTSTTQCHSNNDCQRFAGAICDVTQRVCVASHDAGTTTPDAGATADAVESCTGPGGCFTCTPVDESQILAHCTDSTCVPFNNSRLTFMGDDGGLRPLPQ